MARRRIESYSFGHIVFGGEAYTQDLIILPDRILDGWWRDEGHSLKSGDLEAVFEARPDVLIVGQGAFGRMRVLDETKRALEQAGIELVVSRTEKAVEQYNAAPEDQAVAAALHLTC